MMEYRDDLKAYLDGELPEPQAEKVRAALESDPSLQKELDDLTKVGTALAQMKQEYEAKGLAETLSALSGPRQALATQGTQRKGWVGYVVGLGLAAALALIFAVPQMLSATKQATAGKAMLASNSFAAASKSRSPFAPVRPPRAQELQNMVKTVTSAPAVPKVPMSLQDRLAAADKQLEQLKRENQALKKRDSSPSNLDMSPPMSGRLPALPVSPEQIEPNLGQSKSTVTEAFALPSKKGISPKRVNTLEVKVRELLSKAGAKVDPSTGPPELRSLSAVTDRSKVVKLASQVRAIVKDAGTVNIENVLPRIEQNDADDKILAQITDLKIQRERLLVDFLPDAPNVKAVDQEIKIAQERLKPKPAAEPTPKSRLRITIG